jgi:hypothetical protein
MAGGSEVQEEEVEVEEVEEDEEEADEEAVAEGQCSARTPSWRHAERCSAVSDAHEPPLEVEKNRASTPPRPHEYRELAAGLHEIERLCAEFVAVPERPVPTATTQLARRC